MKQDWFSAQHEEWIKTLTPAFSPERALEIVRIIKAQEDSCMCDVLTPQQELAELLSDVSFGWETARTENTDLWDPHYGDALFEYLNMGDPYKVTIVWDFRDGSWQIGCWGDYLEALEAEALPSEEEEDEDAYYEEEEEEDD